MQGGNGNVAYHGVELLLLVSMLFLYMKSSLKQQRIDIKLFQIADATPGLDLRGATCVKKPLPRSAQRKTSKQPSAILDLRRKYMVFWARSYAANTKEKPTVVRKLLPRASMKSAQTFLSIASYTPSQYKVVDVLK